VFVNGEGNNAIAYSLREKDGKLLWQTNLIGAGLPSLGDGSLFLTSNCYYYRLSPADGSVIWAATQCAGGGPRPSAYRDEHLYVADIPAGNIVDSGNGEILAGYPSYIAPPAVFARGKKIFGLSLEDDTNLDCWDAVTGELVWQFNDETETQTPPVVVNGTIYVATNSALYGLNPKNGKPLWSDPIPGGIFAAGLNAGADTLVLTTGTKVIAYRPQ
jgi:outer membrane protein assembly factor BamB